MEVHNNSSELNVTDVYTQPHMPPPPPYVMTEEPLKDFKKYAYVITCVLGIIGNVFIIYIFTRTKLKKPSTSRYLAAAAVADSGFLLVILLTYITNYFNIPIRNSKGPCQLITFGNFAFPFLSTWYLTAVIVEKYIGVSWPRKKSRMCTVFRAKCVIISLAILSIVCYLYTTFFFGVFEPFSECMIFYFDSRVIEAWVILSRMDAIVNFAIPYIIMFILTCLISKRAWEYHKSSRTAGERYLRRRKITGPEDKEFKTTPMLILLVSCTLLFCTPNNSSSLRRVFTTRQPYSEADLYLMAIFHYLAVLNNAIKIIVYIAASNAFVKELGKIFCFLRSVLRKSENTELQACHHNSLAGNNPTQSVATSTEGIV